MNHAARLPLRRLLKLLELSPAELKQAVNDLTTNLAGRGLTLIDTGETLTLGTNPTLGPWLKTLIKEELTGPIGRAGLETLSIILYHGPVSRPDIDWIRGVNSSFTIRQLLIRGLISRELPPTGGRPYQYQPTAELLAHLGLARQSDLPDYDQFSRDLISATTDRQNYGASE
jgi:segregation and condensation protein B